MKRMITLISLPLFFLAGCRKEADASIMLGSWKTSYGDTIVFSIQNQVNVVTYNETMNPLMPIRKDHRFTYENGKLGITRALSPGDMYFYQTFQWLDPGKRVFQIQGTEWFSFVNSTAAQFTFTKIQ